MVGGQGSGPRSCDEDDRLTHGSSHVAPHFARRPTLSSGSDKDLVHRAVASGALDALIPMLRSPSSKEREVTAKVRGTRGMYRGVLCAWGGGLEMAIAEMGVQEDAENDLMTVAAGMVCD